MHLINYGDMCKLSLQIPSGNLEATQFNNIKIVVVELINFLCV